MFDEVMTGFRVAPGGAQAFYGVVPDLTTLGKVIGGGLPVGAYGGRADLMGLVAPSGPVYQAGTLSGNPLAMAAGLAVLRNLDDAWPLADRAARTTVAAIEDAARQSGVPVQAAQRGAMFGFFLSDEPVTNWAGAQRSDREGFRRLHAALLAEGVYLAPSPFEAAFTSSVHTSDVTEAAAGAFLRGFAAI